MFTVVQDVKVNAVNMMTKYVVIVGLFLTFREIYAGNLIDVTIAESGDPIVKLTLSPSGTIATFHVNYKHSTVGQIVINLNSVVLQDTTIEQGNSTYQISSLDLPDPGTYPLLISVTKGADSYHAEWKVGYHKVLSGFHVNTKQRFLAPYQQIEISSSLKDGTDAIFAMDFIQVVHVQMKCYDNLYFSSATHAFNNTGSYNLSVVAANYVSTEYGDIPLKVIHPLNSFTVTESHMTLQTSEEATYTITLENGAQLPMGNISLFVDCGGVTNSNELLVITPGDSKNKICNFNIQGNYTVTLIIENGLGNITNIYDLYVWDLLLADLRLDNRHVEVNVSIEVYLVDTPSSGFQYVINFGNGFILENRSSDILYSPYFPINLADIIYTRPGDYDVSFTAYNQMYIMSKSYALIANIKIEGLTVKWGELVVAVRTTYVVDVNITKGSSVIITVDYDDGSASVLIDYDDHYYQANYQYNQPGHYIINVNASNPISSMTDTYGIDVIHDLNGFSVDIVKNPIQTTDYAVFKIVLDGAAEDVMGNLNLNISPCETSNVNKSLFITAGNTMVYQCLFLTQGNYTVNLTIYSQLGTSIQYTFEVYVWDVLEVYMAVNQTDFAVFSQPVFQIVDPPPSGFQYTIDFGENTTTSNTTLAILLAGYIDIVLPTSYNYNAPKQYYVTFTAFNDIYEKSNVVVLNAQYGLPAGYLLVSPDRTYVIPDDFARFAIYSNSNSSEPQPTNVTCNIDYGDGYSVPNELTDFEYNSEGLGLRLVHTYTTPGTYSVTLDCHNLVSTISFMHIIFAVEIHPSYFKIGFRRMNLHNETVSGDWVVVLRLYDLTVPPHNIRLEWTFADGSDTEIDDPMTDFVKQHTYTLRGAYRVKLIIRYNGETRRKTLQIYMGASDISLQSSQNIGLVSVTPFKFILESNLLGISVNIQVIWGDSNSTNIYYFEGNSEKKLTHIFAIYGNFTPEIRATSAVGLEFSFLPTSIFIENPASGLVWKFPTAVVVNSKFSPIIIYTDSLFPVKVTCVFDYAEETMVKEDIVFTTPTTIAYGPEYSFQIKGDKSISVNCSTLMTHQILEEHITVISDCFTFGRMFEPEYRNMGTHLKAYMSSLPVISGKIEITEKCKNTTDRLTFRWVVEKREYFEWMELNIRNPGTKVFKPALSSEIVVGFYRLTCYLAVIGEKNESINDFMYLELINPPLIAQIAGGSQRIFGTEAEISLDAVSYSYDPVIGYGKQDNLAFSWQCYHVVDSDLDKYLAPESNDTSHRLNNRCGISLASAGLITVSTSLLPSDAWYLFEAIVSKDSRSAQSLQAINIVNQTPIETFLKCKWNCEVKTSWRQRMIYEVEIPCSGCTDAQIDAATYHWTLYQYNSPTYQPLDNTDSHFKSAPSDRIFDLDSDYLEPGKDYKLKVTVSNVGTRSDGWADVVFTVNEDPYGGICTVLPGKGIASVEDFLFECMFWGDEGVRPSRQRTVDASEPLTYVITQLKGTESQIIYSGNEKSTTQKLELCPEENDYSCSIEFKIQDLFSAEAVVMVDVQVKNPSPDLPRVSLSTPYSPSESDQQHLTEFLESAELALDAVSMTNDSEKSAKLASAYMSAINTLQVPQVAADDVTDAAVVAEAAGEDVEAIVNNALDFLTAPDLQSIRIRELLDVIPMVILPKLQMSPLRRIYLTTEHFKGGHATYSATYRSTVDLDKRILAVMKTVNRTQFRISSRLSFRTTEILAKSILRSVKLLTVVPGDIDTVASTTTTSDVLKLMLSSLVTVIRNPKLVKPNVQADVTTGIHTLSQVLVDSLKNSRDITQIELAIKAIGNAQSVLNKNQAALNVVQNLEDLDGSEVFVTKELSDGEKLFSDIERDNLKKMVAKRNIFERREIQKHIKLTLETSKAIASNMFLLMDRLQVNRSRVELVQQGYGLALEKDSVSNIMNASRLPLMGINFQLNGVTNTSLGEQVKLELRVMTDNIYNVGDNANFVNAPVITVQIRKTDGSAIEMSKPIIIQLDPVVSPYKLIHPRFIIGDAARMFYHSFYYMSTNHDVCVAVVPVNHTAIVYDIYLRLFTPPTDIEFDYYHHMVLDLGISGTKYCIRAGALRRIGIVYLGLQPRLNQGASTTVTTTTTASMNMNETSTDVLETAYMFRTTTISCFLWHPEDLNWKNDVCGLYRDEDNNSTSCTCPDSSDVVATVSFFVAPNQIDFSTVFSKFDIVGQGAVLGTLILILVIFIMSALYSRYKDGQDVLQWGVSLLKDNFRDDCYFYLITVYTGMIRHGGTRSRIEFNMSGDKGDTGIRVLTDGVRKEFRSGNVLRFIMAVPQSLGQLQCFSIWHNNSGNGEWASWYLNRIEVMDLHTKEKTDFLSYKWLSLEAGQIQTSMTAEHTENLTNFKTMFFEHARHHVTDDHLWLSTILRPVKSHFSRVQRVGVCMAFLLLSMISNAMFFQRKDNKTRTQKFDLELGPLKFNISQLWISMVSAIITALPVFLMMLLFRKSKLRKRDTETGEFKSHWMLPCFKRFKFYKDSVALQKVLVIKDIVDDEEGVLPHAFVYVAWTLVFLSSTVSSFFIILYSMEWGKDISDEYLITFFISFFESLFVLDPFKIVFLAVLFAMILKQIKSVRPTVYHIRYIEEMNHNLGKSTTERRHLNYESPFTDSAIQSAKFKVEQKTKMHKAVSEFVVTVVLLILLCSICYSNRDPHSFVLRTTLQNQLVTPYKPILPLTKVRNTRQYFHWLNYTVLPAMFPRENYKQDKLTVEDRQFLSDQNNFRVGAPRLRQVRQNKIPCWLPYVGDVQCIPRYSMVSEVTNDYCERWNPKIPCKEEESFKITSGSWTYVPAWRIWGIPIQGGFNTYGGGGYIAELDISRPVATKTIQELVDIMWVDRETRAVFLEFTVYCVNLNMFAYISLLAEFPETGSILYYPNIYTFRSLGPTGTLGTYIIICQLLFLVATVVWIVVIVLRLLTQRWTFFMRFWNVVELATVCLSFAAIYLYFVRRRFTDEAIAKFREDDRAFVNFYHIAVWDNFFIIIVSILIAILIIRLIKVMGYTRFTRTVYTVLKHSSKTLPGFFAYIILILMAFAMCGYVYFGSEAREYKDVMTCLLSLFSGVLGHAGFTKMDISLESNWFGLIYFITFIVTVVFTVANIFMAILLDSMDILANDRSAEKDLELTTFLWNCVHDIVTGKRTIGKFKSKIKTRITSNFKF